MFFVLGFQSKLLDHFSDSATKKNYYCLLAGGPQTTGPQASKEAQSCSPSLVHPSIIGPQKVQLPPKECLIQRQGIVSIC